MNERILELMKQADYPAPEIAKRAQKLAELIIKECCDMVSKRPYVDDGVSIYLHPSVIIKRHFGVEE